jgi:hypothetical protein
MESQTSFQLSPHATEFLPKSSNVTISSIAIVKRGKQPRITQSSSCKANSNTSRKSKSAPGIDTPSVRKGIRNKNDPNANAVTVTPTLDGDANLIKLKSLSHRKSVKVSNEQYQDLESLTISKTVTESPLASESMKSFMTALLTPPVHLDTESKSKAPVIDEGWIVCGGQNTLSLESMDIISVIESSHDNDRLERAVTASDVRRPISQPTIFTRPDHKAVKRLQNHWFEVANRKDRVEPSSLSAAEPYISPPNYHGLHRVLTSKILSTEQDWTMPTTSTSTGVPSIDVSVSQAVSYSAEDWTRALETDDLSRLRDMIRSGWDIRSVHVTSTGRTGIQAIHLAAASDSSCVLQLLLSEGCDVDSRDSFKSVPLHYACAHASLKVYTYVVMRHVSTESYN